MKERAICSCPICSSPVKGDSHEDGSSLIWCSNPDCDFLSSSEGLGDPWAKWVPPYVNRDDR